MSLHRHQPTTKPPSSSMLSGVFACTVNGGTYRGFMRDLCGSLASWQEGTH
jgi:hypothetical protein